MPKKIIDVKTEEIRVRIPAQQRKALEELVEKGEYVDVSEAVRAAIREFLRRADER